MRTPPSRYRRSVLDLSRSQAGDVSTRDAAGRDIYQGADADAVLSFLRAYVFEADQRRETALKELGHELKRVRGDMQIITEALRGVRDQVNDDARERHRRQAELDDALAAINTTAARHAAELAALRRASIAGGLVLLGIIAILAILVSREAGWVARAAYDAYLGSPP